jgi:hypothetical protein
VTSVERSSRVGRIGDEAVERVGHLVTNDGKLIHGHQRLVFAVDLLVGDQSSGSDHVCRHSVTNEEDDVLGLALLSQVTDEPSSLGFATIVVVESGSVLAGLVESDAAIGFGRNVDQSGFLRIAGKEVFVPRKVPLLQLRFVEVEVLGNRLRLLTLLPNSEGELLI